MVICQGCGGGFDLPEGYTRNKAQCPSCGVICPVPAGAERQPAGAARRSAQRAARQEPLADPVRSADPSAPEPAMEDPAAAMLHEPEPPGVPLFDDEPPPTPPPQPKAKKKPQEMLVPCRRCGRKVRRQRECPSCDGAVETDTPPDAGDVLDMNLDN